MPSSKPLISSNEPNATRQQSRHSSAPSSASTISGDAQTTAHDPRAERYRRYTLRPYLDGPVLMINCASDPHNDPRVDSKDDKAWDDRTHTLHPDRGEVVELTIADTRIEGELLWLTAIRVGSDGTPEPWSRTPSGAVSQPLRDPGTNDHTVEFTLIIMAIAGGASPQVRTTKCPVKVVFGPRLGGD